MKNTLLMLALLLTVLSVPFLLPRSPTPAARPASHAIVYNPRGADRESQLDQGDGGLTACFDRAMRGLLRAGFTDRKQIVGFAVVACGSGYRRQMIGAGASAEAADDYLELVATQQLDDIVRP